MQSTVVYEYTELPEKIRELLEMYYRGTDHRPINNNSYSRFPYIFDFDLDEEPDELEEWFLKNGAAGYPFIMIHWEW